MSHITSMFSRGTFRLAALLLLVSASRAFALHATAEPPPATDLFGTVTDSLSGRPIGSAQISVMQGARIVVNTTTDDFGRYRVHNLDAGTYTVGVHALGFRALGRNVTITGTAGSTQVNFALGTIVLNLEAVEVHATTPIAVNTRTGDQVFNQNEYHGAPTATTSQILQQSIAGAVRAPTGEVHIRGQHAEYTYYVDGIPVPAGISGSLNELFDPQVVNQISFQTGGWDAEYGNKNAAVVNVSTKIPAGGFHADASAFGGSFGTLGQALSLSTNEGRLGLFGSFSRQVTDMRREPVAFDTTTFVANNFHNHGEDLFGFGKASYSLSTTDVFNLDANWSRTTFQVPFNPALVTTSDDSQQDINAFLNFGWRHQFAGNAPPTKSADAELAQPSELFTGLFYRHGSLNYTPGANDQPQFTFFPDTTTPYNVREARGFNIVGAKVDYLQNFASELQFKTGMLVQHTSGNENFTTVDASGRPGPASQSTLSGSDVGGYAQIAYAPIEKVEIRAGARYDAHTAPFAGTKTQFSPRVRINLYPGAATTLYAYYGRLFVPTNVEELRTITNSTQGTAADPTLPERDYFLEGGIIHRFPVAGLVAKLSGYYKQSEPGVDDGTIPGTAIVTAVNVQRIFVNGLEGVLEVRPNGPFSGYLNVALSHAFGNGPITGGFFPAATPSGYFDLDHDQRLSIVGSGTYTVSQFFLNATAIYGSGLTNGRTSDDVGHPQGTGFLDFNKEFKVNPSTIVNASAGYTIVAGQTLVRPQIYVDNLFDKHYLLKGAFFSAAQVGRPRSVQVRLNVSI